MDLITNKIPDEVDDVLLADILLHTTNIQTYNLFKSGQKFACKILANKKKKQALKLVYIMQ